MLQSSKFYMSLQCDFTSKEQMYPFASYIVRKINQFNYITNVYTSISLYLHQVSKEKRGEYFALHAKYTILKRNK